MSNFKDVDSYLSNLGKSTRTSPVGIQNFSKSTIDPDKWYILDQRNPNKLKVHSGPFKDKDAAINHIPGFDPKDQLDMTGDHIPVSGKHLLSEGITNFSTSSRTINFSHTVNPNKYYIKSGESVSGPFDNKEVAHTSGIHGEVMSGESLINLKITNFSSPHGTGPDHIGSVRKVLTQNYEDDKKRSKGKLSEDEHKYHKGELAKLDLVEKHLGKDTHLVDTEETSDLYDKKLKELKSKHKPEIIHDEEHHMEIGPPEKRRKIVAHKETMIKYGPDHIVHHYHDTGGGVSYLYGRTKDHLK